jgi:hypothetical protein
MTRTDGAAVQCPACLARFGGMIRCPWDGATLIPLPDADPTAVAFYNAILDGERKPHVRAPAQEEFLRTIAEVGGSAHLEDLALYFDISDATARRSLDGLVVQGKLTVTRRPSVYTLVRP